VVLRWKYKACLHDRPSKRNVKSIASKSALLNFVASHSINHLETPFKEAGKRKSSYEL
jgi:hypothetical protein